MNNCATCDYQKNNPDGGHCYMFYEEPQYRCMQHTGHKGVPQLVPPSLHQRSLDSLKLLTRHPELVTAADMARVELTIKALQEHLFGTKDRA